MVLCAEDLPALFPLNIIIHNTVVCAILSVDYWIQVVKYNHDT